MPKYLYTSDLRISMLIEKIQKTASYIVRGGSISDINDKSDNNNATTLAFYFNLYNDTQTCTLAAENPIDVVRNYILKFQFPNTRTRDSYNDSLSENTLFAPYRAVIHVLYRMSEFNSYGTAQLTLSEILFFLFCNKEIYTNPHFDVDKLINLINLSRKNNQDIEERVKNAISWKQYGRQIREMMTVLTIAYDCFKLQKDILSFSTNNMSFIDNKESIKNILAYHYMWYPSDVNDFHKAEKEYTRYMDMKESSYSVIDYHVDNNRMTSITEDIAFTTFRPYITAIKSKPFLLLAGISGTGKSRIVRELARACWDVGSEEYKAQKPRNFEMVQVKPNWHDSSELIGYISRVNGSPTYVAGDFLKFVARAWEEIGIPYFLCLDEMNLAPVEQYFAEYLSVIETRRCDDVVITTDAILKPEYDREKDKITGRPIPKRWYANLISELLASCPDEKSFGLTNQFYEDGICLPPNLIVVGTVNMDETTFSFSRKVLDRAMTIEMNEVNLSGGLVERHERIGKLGSAELIGNAVEGVDVYQTYKDECRTAIKYLEAINSVLDGTPFKIAYRTRNEVLLYVVNNLPYNKDKEGNDLSKDYVIARALDEITNMKILSRIEGDETRVSSKFLDELGNTIKEKLVDVRSGLFDSDEYQSISIAKLDVMKKRLKSGYTSFWS